jgi:hypothetical protein
VQQVTAYQQVPVPAPASQQLPMEWAAEDAAEHAYNLAQWRVKILRAKMEQATLRKQLMAVAMGEVGDPQTSLSSGPAAGGAAPQLKQSRGRDAGELRQIKGSLLALAKETVGAIKQLKGQMVALRNRQHVLAKRPAEVPVKQEQTALAQAEAKIKAQKEKEVQQLKSNMDKQLSALLGKVTSLISKRASQQ